MPDLQVARFLARHRRAQGDQPSLLSLAFDSRAALYPFYRARLAWLGLLYRTLLGAIVWRAIAERYPIFDWNPLFLQLQLLYVVEAAVELVTETTRGELRRLGPNPATWSGGRRLARLLAAAPLLAFGLRMAIALSYAGRYFGLYDAIIGIACLRVLVSAAQAMVLARLGYDRRLPIFAWNWLLPPLLAAGAFFALEPVEGPWSIALYLGADLLFGALLQQIRLIRLRREIPRRYFRPARKRAPAWGEFARHAAGRLPALFVYSTLHFIFAGFYGSGLLSARSAITLHVLTPFYQLIARSPRFLWKDWIDLGPVRAGRIHLARAQRISALAGAAGFALIATGSAARLGAALALSFASALALECWVNGTIPRGAVMPVVGGVAIALIAALSVSAFPPLAWLGIALVVALERRLARAPGPEPALAREQACVARFRARFWANGIRGPALQELDRRGIAYRIRYKQLVFPRGVDQREQILDWGRGWLMQLGPLSEPPAVPASLGPLPPGLARWDWWKARWVAPPPADLRRRLSAAVKRQLLAQIHHAIETERPSGKQRAGELVIRWEIAERYVDLRFESRPAETTLPRPTG